MAEKSNPRKKKKSTVEEIPEKTQPTVVNKQAWRDDKHGPCYQR